MKKTYTVSDLFFTSWKELKPRAHAEVYALQQNASLIPSPSPGGEGNALGFAIIAILRRLRKNPSLVNKINVEQAVDIYNSLTFLNEPWYYFPPIENKTLALSAPDPDLARHSFDQFIYADNEFSTYVINQDPKYLERLVVTLYPLLGDEFFDKESVEARAAAIAGKLKHWQLELVFFTYAHVREKIMKRCKTLLPAPAKKQSLEGEEIAESLEEITAKATPTGAMWYRIKHQVARTSVFGGFEGTGQANMYYVLDHLEILCQEKANAKP
jgi:hypothetical protein